LQIAIYKNGQIIAILQIIKIPSIGNFCKFTKTAKLLQFCKLQFIKTAKLFHLQIAIYKNGQINAIWQIIKIPLYKNLFQFIKTAKIIAI
jgi:hypothetical protein